MANPPITAESSTAGVPAVDAVHTGDAQQEASIAVRGHSATGRGVSGFSHADYAMRAHSDQLSGIRATSYDGVGVEGECITRPDGTSGGPAGSGGTAAGVAGSSAAGAGVSGTGTTAGVVGLSAEGAGVIGNGKTAGVEGSSAAGPVTCRRQAGRKRARPRQARERVLSWWALGASHGRQSAPVRLAARNSHGSRAIIISS